MKIHISIYYCSSENTFLFSEDIEKINVFLIFDNFLTFNK